MPGFFGKQSVRLVRDFWSNAQSLAEELFAMFADNKPMETDQPLILTRNTDAPAIRIIDNSSNGGDPIQIIRNQITQQYSELQRLIREVLVMEQGGALSQQAIPGLVRSGSNNEYTVELYEDGWDQAATASVPVRQLQIRAGAAVQAGVWVVVYRLRTSQGDTLYFMQEPVWRPRPA